jgi:hypothetical protein
MRRIFLLLVFLLTNMILLAQNTNNEAAQIKQQMSAIRKSTNWGDPAAAKEANAKIEALSVKLTQALRKSSQTQQQGQQGGNETPTDAKTKNDIQQEMDEYNSKLMGQMMKIVREGGKWDLAEPLREEIVEEYKEDENPTVKNHEWLQSMPYLLINMSRPRVDVIIEQMPLFKGVKTLIITTEKTGTPVNLEEILRNASGYPLEELYIINFGPSVSGIPGSVGDFSGLIKLCLTKNNIKQLPSSISNLKNLKVLYTDFNPLNRLMPAIGSLQSLKELGIADTSLSEPEISQIHQSLPQCKILRQ